MPDPDLVCVMDPRNGTRVERWICDRSPDANLMDGHLEGARPLCDERSVGGCFQLLLATDGVRALEA